MGQSVVVESQLRIFNTGFCGANKLCKISKFNFVNMVGMYHPVTHVIFDMDGLLLDSETRYDDAHVMVCQKYGKEFTFEASKAAMGKTPRGTAETIVEVLDLPITTDQFLEEIEGFYGAVFQKYIEFMPGVERLVKHFKENNVPIAIGSNSKKSNFELKCKHHAKFFQSFHHIVLAGDDPDVKNGKPAPDVYLVAAKRFEEPPKDMKNVLVFEDSVSGVKAGIEAGAQVVWIPNPTVDIKSAPVSATLVLPSLEKFEPEWFNLPSYK
ncbi:Pseudouridine-5'-phosphatase [Orchesella cincta]|uniref:Pseudouridine-5'-phosphatase n=1 Tax=Orchesella cincta TaxID=48709 RepID=A0A1D2MPN4_ORCCI|nr:Pseudouridine-5'-phosphatase [Orchesella cincta]